MGLVDTPAMPRFDSMSLPKELTLNDWERLRLKLNWVLSTSFVVQLWLSPIFALWPSVDELPAVSGKLPRISARRTEAVARAKIEFPVDRLGHSNVDGIGVGGQAALQQKILHGP